VPLVGGCPRGPPERKKTFVAERNEKKAKREEGHAASATPFFCILSFLSANPLFHLSVITDLARGRGIFSAGVLLLFAGQGFTSAGQSDILLIFVLTLLCD
jgi:hypothetical protein